MLQMPSVDLIINHLVTTDVGCRLSGLGCVMFLSSNVVPLGFTIFCIYVLTVIGLPFVVINYLYGLFQDQLHFYGQVINLSFNRVNVVGIVKGLGQWQIRGPLKPCL